MRSWFFWESVHFTNIASGMILVILTGVLQERLIASTNVGSFPG